MKQKVFNFSFLTLVYLLSSRGINSCSFNDNLRLSLDEFECSKIVNEVEVLGVSLSNVT